MENVKIKRQYQGVIALSSIIAISTVTSCYLALAKVASLAV